MQELIIHEKQHGNYVTTAIIGGIAVALIIVIGTVVPEDFFATLERLIGK